MIADNKLALNAGWDNDILAIELLGLIDLDFDVSLTGFSLAEIDFVFDDARVSSTETPAGPEDAVPMVPVQPVTRRGDLWLLGRHKLVCGDARDDADYVALLGNETADLVFTDPPYNVRVDGNVCGSGAIKHAEFAMASGEMSADAFTAFLAATLGAMARHSRDGAIAFVCMDWRHMGELLTASHTVFTELKNLVVWNKTNGGMGTFYRSKHEPVFVWKVGTAAHTFSLPVVRSCGGRTTDLGLSKCGPNNMDWWTADRQLSAAHRPNRIFFRSRFEAGPRTKIS